MLIQVPNSTIEQLLEAKPSEHNGHSYYVPYTVNGVVHKVPPWAHPNTIATRVLNEIQHTHYYGLQVIAPPGNGKTTVAKIISSKIINKAKREFGIDFDFRLEVERKTHAFENLDSYIRSLPKRPVIVVFDDLSGVFGQLSDEQIDKNFETLTQVRWILDPVNGKIPFIPILTYHYSKVVEKKFRSQNGMSIFCRFGNEERTNLDTIAPKRTQARRAAKNFMEILKTMYVKHHFNLMFPDGKMQRYDTDLPFRACLMISDDVGNVIVSSKYDIIDQCNYEAKRRKTNEYEAVLQLKKSYGLYGIQALRIALHNRGIDGAVNPMLQNAMRFVESKFLPAYDYDYNKLLEGVYKLHKMGRPKKANRKLKLEKEVMKVLDSMAFEPEDDDNTKPGNPESKPITKSMQGNN